MSVPDAIFIVVIDDRHVDITIEPWLDRGEAIERCNALARANASHGSDWEVADVASFEFLVRYSCEGDRAFVKRTPLRGSARARADWSKP